MSAFTVSDFIYLIFESCIAEVMWVCEGSRKENSCAIISEKKNKLRGDGSRSIARILHGGGGGGGGRPCMWVWWYPPPGNFETLGYLRQHFVRFEDNLLGNKAGKKSEGH